MRIKHRKKKRVEEKKEEERLEKSIAELGRAELFVVVIKRVLVERNGSVYLYFSQKR